LGDGGHLRRSIGREAPLIPGPKRDLAIRPGTGNRGSLNNGEHELYNLEADPVDTRERGRSEPAAVPVQILTEGTQT
jgi:hypothetical protein